MRAWLCVVFVLSTGLPSEAQVPVSSEGDAHRPPGSSAQTSDSSSGNRPWQVNFSLLSAFDGNLTHDLLPLRSYGVSPAAALRYEPGGPFVWGYEVALNRYTGTDEWDRVSHGLYVVMTHRIGPLRLETGGDATWKGSSEDRELSNEFGVSGRIVWKVSDATRVLLSGGSRYKQYPDDPDTSGVSPYVGGKIVRRFGDQRVTLGYKFQTRQSRAQRDRYRRHAYSLGFSMPIDLPGDTLSFELEYRPQTYDRLITVGDTLALREDRRVQLAAVYERPLSARANIVWFAGFERRESNDPRKRYTAPSLAVTVKYRWR